MSIVTLNDRGVRSVTTFGSLTTGSMIFIKKLTASSSSTLSFVDGSSDVVLDSTYKEYLFTFNNIHPQTTEDFMFQCNAAGGSGYNETITSTTFETYNAESGGTPGVGYDTGRDQAQGTSFQKLTAGVGNDNDQSASGTLMLFNPSSTTFVKHFISDFHEAYHADYATHSLYAGYFNTTSAIDAIQFKMHSGNMDAGTIKLYGVKDS